MFDLEFNIRSWCDHLRARGNFKEEDIIELENHLRDETADLTKAGLSPDESFLISVKRLGNVSLISQEFSKINSDNLWKHLLTEPRNSAAKAQNRRSIALVVLFSLLAGSLAKLPELFGIRLSDESNIIFYFKNLGLFILPFVAVYFLVKGNAHWKKAAVISGIFCLSAIIINLYPSYAPKHTAVLTGLHLPIFLWLLTGVAYAGTKWRTVRGRMDFIRFSGEAFIYGVLISCGTVVLGMFIQVLFSAIQLKLPQIIWEYLAV